WDGQYIYDDVWRELNDEYMQNGGKVYDREYTDIRTGQKVIVYKNWELTGLNNWYLGNQNTTYEKLMAQNRDNPYALYYGKYPASPSGDDTSAKFETRVLEGFVDTSRLMTEGGRVLSGGNLTLDVKELVNKNSKISAGGTLTITNKAEKIENTTEAMTVKVYDGKETLSYWETKISTGGDHTITYYYAGINRSLLDNVRDYNIADGVSVIEGNNVIIEGTPVINNGYDYTNIKTGAIVDPSTITSRDVDVDLYYDPVTVHVDRTAVIDIVNTGIIPFNNQVFNQSISKLFTQNSDPTSKYMLETRSQYIDLSRFFGSDYFLNKIGYDENSDWNKARRLGDAYYETKYMNNLLLETLGTRFINGKADTELMKELLDNAVATSGDLQLTIGVSLTKEQIAALKSDIIWYVEQEVNGEKVLVPQLYLSQATLENIKSPTTTISAQETLAINSSTLVNQGRLSGNTVYVNTDNLINKSVGALTAEITGTNVQIDAKNDILNIGAVISAKEDLMLTAGGTISNITTGVETTEHDRLEGKERTRIYDDIQNVGVISSGDLTYIEGEKYVSRGAVTESGGTTYIEADDVSINTIALKDYERTKENHGYDLYRTTEKLGSEVTGLDNVIIEASNDINIKGSKVVTDGTIQLTAENDINIENDKNTVYTESKRDKKGTFSSYSKLETNYQESAVASNLAGNNVILNAGNDVNIRASNVIAVKNDNIENTGGNIIITAENDINITTDDMNNEYYLKEKKSGFSTNFSNTGGGMSAGVSYSKNSLEINSNSTTVAVSSLLSEGSTVLEAGNKIKTEAMQASVGENLIIRGVNGVELLDAKEVYEEKVKQKSTSVGFTASVGSTITSFISEADEVSQNSGKYGFDNRSQLINTYGDGLSVLINGTKAASDGSQLLLDGMKGTLGNISSPKDLLNYGISANVSLGINQNKYESNTSGTNSVAGVINVGQNLIIQSEGDVKLVNQKINVGENIIVDAKSFEARAGENTYSNNTNSSSKGGSVGYDFTGGTVTGGINGSKGDSNTSSKIYDNTKINAGGTFILNTEGDATFEGANVTADKIKFDIGGDLNVISLQDEFDTKGSNKSAGVNYGYTPERGSDGKMGGYASPSGSVSYGETNGNSRWVSDQTSIIADNGGSIKAGETLTNKGAVIGSLNEPLEIDAKKLVVENLKDNDNGESYNVGFSGMDLKNPIPETALQYQSHDKEQDTNATFSNVKLRENGEEVDLEGRGINTDITKAQVVTKDDVVDPIDTVLHTDLLNKNKRDAIISDINTLVENSEIIGTAIATKLDNNKNGSSDAEVWELEKQSLANITKAAEVAIKNKENLSITDEERNDLDKLAEKYNDYGVKKIEVVSNDTVFRDSEGNVIEGAQAGYDKSTGIIYITKDVAGKPLGEFNRIVGEEIGELYAHNNGLATKTGGAEQIGQIFGKEMSKGKDSDSEYTGTITVNNNIKDIKVDGTEVITVTVVGATVIVGGIIYYFSDTEAARVFGAAVEAEMAKKVDFLKTVGTAGIVAMATIYKAKKQSKKTKKERATDTPSWSKGKKPNPGEKKEAFLKRIMDEQYGEGNWNKKAPEYSKLKKAFDRGGL
ncbi:hemagglutinin repeat-containing protein, partial [Sebaldella sp. S0638]|uniref:hemagglutinin repeat-containing protein n=1 Tax=Sebaldella sp. S0638 TaxID=2957809 RepID=UPI00209DE610